MKGRERTTFQKQSGRAESRDIALSCDLFTRFNKTEPCTVYNIFQKDEKFKKKK